MKKIILTKEESYYLGQLYRRVSYAFSREDFETYNSFHLEYQDELVKLKKKYNIDTHTSIQRIDFTSEYMVIEDSIYGDL